MKYYKNVNRICLCYKKCLFRIISNISLLNFKHWNENISHRDVNVYAVVEKCSNSYICQYQFTGNEILFDMNFFLIWIFFFVMIFFFWNFFSNKKKFVRIFGEALNFNNIKSKYRKLTAFDCFQNFAQTFGYFVFWNFLRCVYNV